MKENFSYYSNVLKQPFDTIDELKKAELTHLKDQEEKEKKLAEKKKRVKEIEDAYKAIKDAENRYLELRDAFVADYGQFHMTIRETGRRTVPDLFELMDRFFW